MSHPINRPISPLHPINTEQLVRYWAYDLGDDETDTIEQHLFECESCFEAASQLAALVMGVRDTLPPVAVERDLERLRQQGTRVAVNTFVPEAPQEAWFRTETAVLVHRLLVDPATPFAKASVQFTTLEGAPLLHFDDVPFDPESGAILITCQRHYSSLFPSPDVHVLVRTSDASGRESTTRFTVCHRFE
jgi:hypothetical protein